MSLNQATAWSILSLYQLAPAQKQLQCAETSWTLTLDTDLSWTVDLPKAID